MNYKSAKRFFFRPRSYFSLALPSYFQFDRILTKTRELLWKQNLCDYYHQSAHPRTFSDINYPIIYNKDGEYAWRKYQIVHPFFYTEIVHLLTKETTWNYIRGRVKRFRNPRIVCASMIPAPTSKINKNEQDIFNWAGNFTNETVRKALEYKYMLATDMTNCYDTLPLRLLPWALRDPDDPEAPAIGEQIHLLLGDMLYGQTCGIPQGSVLMDFLAEIILSFLDGILFERLGGILDIFILRYRDDYRIFANDATTARKAMKVLVETLAEFDLKINLSKTFLTSDVINFAFKPDRLAWRALDPLIFGENKLSILKSLLFIRDFGRKYPNCGSLKAALSKLYQREVCESRCADDVWQIAAILLDIMYINPGVWPHCIAILSKYLEARDPATVLKIITHVREKFSDIPNTEYLDIWLQRLSIKADPYYTYDQPACQFLFEQEMHLWNSEWLGMYTSLCDNSAINYDEILAMPAAIPPEEVAFFITNHGSG